jgi:hypothetical protein
LSLTTTRALDTGDEIEISYRGSGTFEIELDYAPVQTDLLSDAATGNVEPDDDSRSGHR